MSTTKHPDLVYASDGLLAREARFYTEEKVHVLERYGTIFNSGMKNLWPTRVYVELLSGPGRYVIRESGKELPGSAVIAAKVLPHFTHLICNDHDGLVVDALKARLTALGHANVSYENKDCNAVVPAVLKHLSRFPGALGFCFIDNTNWQLHFSALERLTTGRRMDLLVLFHSGSMKRVATLSLETLANLSRFFGDDPAGPEWKVRYDEAGRQGRSTAEALLDYYKARLGTIGYLTFEHETIRMNGDSGVPVYQLLFASKNSRGQDFFRKAISRRASGQRELPFAFG